MKFSIIVAIARNGVIGKNNQLPWHLPDDLRFFKKHTLGHPVIMGRKTFESIGKALPGRRNIVVSSDPDFAAPDILRAGGIQEALDLAGEENPFVIGGAGIFRQVLDHPDLDAIYFTRVEADVDGDVTLDLDPGEDWQETFREHHPSDEKHKYPFTFIILQKKR